MKKILLVESSALDKKKINYIKKKFNRIKFFLTSTNKNEINRKIKNMDAIINPPRNILDNSFLKNCNKLKWIHIGGAGIEDFLSEKLVKRKIVLTNGKILQGPSVADHAIALLLSLTRNIKHHIKPSSGFKISRPIELYKKSALIFGTGGIGSLVAERLKAFGMNTYGIDEEMVNLNAFYDELFIFEELNSIIKEADVVICCSALTNKTKNIFNKKIFNKMKKNSFFINVSRGKLVNTKDLCYFIKKKHFRGVGLDVTDPEPLVEKSILINHPNVILTPHVAGPSDNNRERSFDLVLKNLSRFSRDQILLNLVDLKKGY